MPDPLNPKTPSVPPPTPPQTERNHLFRATGQPGDQQGEVKAEKVQPSPHLEDRARVAPTPSPTEQETPLWMAYFDESGARKSDEDILESMPAEWLDGSDAQQYKRLTSYFDRNLIGALQALAKVKQKAFKLIITEMMIEYLSQHQDALVRQRKLVKKYEDTQRKAIAGEILD